MNNNKFVFGLIGIVGVFIAVFQFFAMIDLYQKAYGHTNGSLFYALLFSIPTFLFSYGFLVVGNREK